MKMCLVCVLCAPFRHMLPRHGLMGLFNHGARRPGALPVIVQKGEGCIRGLVGGCLADLFPPLPCVVPSVGVPKWTVAS